MAEDKKDKIVTVRIDRSLHQRLKVGIATQRAASFQELIVGLLVQWLQDGSQPIEAHAPQVSGEGLDTSGLSRKDLQMISGIVEMLREGDRRTQTIKLQVEHWMYDKEREKPKEPPPAARKRA